MNERVREFETVFIELLNTFARFNCMSRAKEYQQDTCERLAEGKAHAITLKEQTILLQDEDAANTMLCFEMMLDAFYNGLRMWILLKEDKPDDAWDCLIRAQMACNAALRAHEIGQQHIDGYGERLHALEELLFPPMLFCSVGMIVERSTCSICGGDYDTCDHIKGRAYLGRFCYGEIAEVKEVSEVSIVDSPANKMCRIFTISDGEGISRNVMTWRVVGTREPNVADAVVATTKEVNQGAVSL